MPAEFRPITEATIAAALDMMPRLYGSQPFDPMQARAALERLLADPRWGGAWLIESEGKTSGYLVLTVCFSLEFRGRYGLLDELYLEPEARGRGIGKEALDFVAEECRRRGFAAVRLEVGLDNARALALYQREGFTAHKRYLMTKWIDHAS
ncbi:MAG TPA: GNAT family N-acetyltransferase [Bryobacteraceae bacterium]